MGRSVVGRVAISLTKAVYVIGFGWWLEPLLKRQAERNLMTDVTRDLGFLFAKYAAHFVPNEREYRWGKVLTLATRNVKIRVSKDRGEYGIALSPVVGKSEWALVSDVLAAVASECERPPYEPISLSEWSKLLEPQFARLEAAYEPERYPITKRNLEQVKADTIAKMKTEVEALNADRARRRINLNSR